MWCGQPWVWRMFWKWTSKYERKFSLLICVENAKILVYVETPHLFNVFFWECNVVVLLARKVSIGWVQISTEGNQSTPLQRFTNVFSCLYLPEGWICRNQAWALLGLLFNRPWFLAFKQCSIRVPNAFPESNSTLKKKVEPKWLHPGTVLGNGSTFFLNNHVWEKNGATLEGGTKMAPP